MRTFEEYLRRVKPAVNARIESVANSKLKDDQLVRMLMGGKRLRAGLLMLVYEATSGKDYRRVLDLACAIELAHSASLIIDDMLDGDEVRRGVPTVHLTEGHKRAMLDTVGILSLPYDLVVPFGKDYVQSLADTQRGMVTGVLKELFYDPELPASKIYDLIILQKTGRGFGLASSWGYIAGRNGTESGNIEVAENWREYGIRVGKAMQIADDIADLGLAMASKKQSSPGSELLLLRCVNAERLARELFSDIRKLDLHIEKAWDLWSSDGTQKALRHRLEAELIQAEEAVDRMHLAQSRLMDIVVSAPREIAVAMLRSSDCALHMMNESEKLVLSSPTSQ